MDGSSFATVVGAAGHVFDPATGNAVTVALPAGLSARHVRLRFSGNTGPGRGVRLSSGSAPTIRCRA